MPQTIVIFGASGDLTRRKLIPALYQLYRKNRLPEHTRIVGFSRTPMPDDQWRQMLAESTRNFVGDDFDPEVWRQFAPSIYYQPGDIAELEEVRALQQRLQELEEGQAATSRIYYLATAPQFFEPAVEALKACGMTRETSAPRRLVVEKPFGTDLKSAQQLNEKLHTAFAESQIFRIDHYLGKETVQNILVLRFANTIFEPVWNRNYIDHVQITAAEDEDVGSRGGYYDKAGVMRDMFQNHLLQLLTFVAMEPPSRFAADTVRNEKVKVLEAIQPFEPEEVVERTFRGQYIGYRQAKGVAPDSETATFAAVKFSLGNWRWEGVPFYLRSGKAMDCRSTQIVIQFRQPPHLMFEAARMRKIDGDRLVIQIQPAEGIQLHFQTKVPDAGMQMRLTDLDFRFDSRFAKALPEAYERLLLDVMAGDASLFARSDEVELCWGLIDPILETWHRTGLPELAFYEPGMWGPKECNKWIWRDGRDWFDVCPTLK